jgi:hypothetical protein
LVDLLRSTAANLWEAEERFLTMVAAPTATPSHLPSSAAVPVGAGAGTGSSTLGVGGDETRLL